jgi:hypothetical protein
MKRNYFLLISFFLIISGCTSRQYFEPSIIDGDYELKEVSFQSEIIDINSDGATLKDYKIISKDGLSLNHIKFGFRFLNNINGIILSADKNNNLLIKSDKDEKIIKFDKNIISASIKDNLLAISFIDNSMILYDLKLKQTLFKEYFASSIINDTKIANPIFLNSVILYPTLDGKVLVVDIEKKILIKTMNIDPTGKINNIIFLSPLDDILIIATSSKLFSFINGRVISKDFDIRNIIRYKKDIIISTLDGEIIKLNKRLEELNRKKFKFAKFYTLGAGEYIYALELSDYLIRIDSSFKDIKIFKFDFDEDKKAISIGNKLYFDNKTITLD